MHDDARVYPPRIREVEARRTTNFAADLNAAQLKAATHADGPLLIIAGAGTGKTRTLVYRVAHLLENGIRPERILANPAHVDDQSDLYSAARDDGVSSKSTSLDLLRLGRPDRPSARNRGGSEACTFL